MLLNRLLSLFIFLAVLLPAPGDPPPRPASTGVKAELADALSQRLQAAPENKSLTFDLFTPELDSAYISPGRDKAVLWLALRDDTDRLVASEPGLALARRANTGWQVLLPGDPGWEETLAALPEGMLPLEMSPAPATAAASLSAERTAALTGYYLPYAAGTARWLEGSISHFQYIPELGYPSCSIDTCRYAFDFTDRDHFPLLASKNGTVLASRDSCRNGGSNCTNYIVLGDTNGQTHQIYLHLAQGTIPDKLTPGTLVQRGQYIGDSDDTGYSTSQHVHFMVVDSLWQGGDGYYWGRSVPIRFADVPVNNGIPRNCYEVTHFPIYDGATECLGNRADPRNPANDWYVSGNVGAYPPAGTLTKPAAGAVVAVGSGTMLDVSATASDDVRITGVRLVARTGGQWVEIGPKVTQPAGNNRYDWKVDLCAAGPFNGPLEVALRAWDHEGNITAALSPRTIRVDHACPPPSSQLRAAEKFDSTAVRLSWESAGQAGIGRYELQWRSEPGTWDAAQTLTIAGSQRSAWFAGLPGGSYAFRLRAVDTNGQTEAWPAGEAAETSAVLPTTCADDAFEPDDSAAQAPALAPGEWAQRNLCGALDPDWFRVEIENAGDTLVRAVSQNGGAAVSITVYAEDGKTVVGSGQAGGIGRNARASFQAAAGTVYLIRVEPLEDHLFGTAAVYRLAVTDEKEIFLPLVER